MHTSNKDCINLIVTPVGGDKWLFKTFICHWNIRSRDSFRNADSSSNEEMKYL